MHYTMYLHFAVVLPYSFLLNESKIFLGAMFPSSLSLSRCMLQLVEGHNTPKIVQRYEFLCIVASISNKIYNYIINNILNDYTVKAVISNMNDGSRYYDHKLTNIEKGRLIDMINKAPVSSVSITTQTPETSALSSGKDKRLFSILQTNSSKKNFD